MCWFVESNWFKQKKKQQPSTKNIMEKEYANFYNSSTPKTQIKQNISMCVEQRVICSIHIHEAHLKRVNEYLLYMVLILMCVHKLPFI